MYMYMPRGLILDINIAAQGTSQDCDNVIWPFISFHSYKLWSGKH